jgi:tRNA(Ile)-lysidine synthase
MAMLRLAAGWGQAELQVVTVDHGLRPEAAQEAQMVAQACAGLGLPHTVLRWQGWDGSGNLQDRARAARYGLIAQWAVAQGLSDILLAHTIEDQAETFLMRLARASGVDGLSAMSDRVTDGVRFHRPLLSARRSDLRTYLSGLGQEWAEDPSNDDMTYDRVKLRARAQDLAQIGLTAQTLAQVSENLALAKAALNWALEGFVRDHVQMVGPDVTVNAGAFALLPTELRRRFLVAALRWISGAEYAPRRAAVDGMLAAIEAGQGATLHGCRLTQRKQRLWLFREYAAVADLTAKPKEVWDNRWILTGPAQPDDVVAPLGAAGLAQLAERNPYRPAAALHADPAVWRAGGLIAAPLSGWSNQWRAKPAPYRTDFVSALSTH